MHFLGIEIGHAATRVVALDLEAATVAAEATAAHTALESGAHVGKIVLIP